MTNSLCIYLLVNCALLAGWFFLFADEVLLLFYRKEERDDLYNRNELLANRGSWWVHFRISYCILMMVQPVIYLSRLFDHKFLFNSNLTIHKYSEQRGFQTLSTFYQVFNIKHNSSPPQWREIQIE